MFPHGIGNPVGPSPNPGPIDISIPDTIFFLLFLESVFILVFFCVAIVAKKMVRKRELVPFVAYLEMAENETAEKERMVMPPDEGLYGKMLDKYMSIYGAMGKWHLERKINACRNQGLSQEEAIQKLAKEEEI